MQRFLQPGLYQFLEMQRAMLSPLHAAAETTQALFQNPMLPMSYTEIGRSIAASAELLERVTRQYKKPEFELKTTLIDGKKVAIVEDTIKDSSKPFCQLIHFRRQTKRQDPRVLVVAPMSGHYATLLRGTVEALLPDHDVYITDWINANQVPLYAGSFNLEDYITYVMDVIRQLGANTHVIAVCQPAVPVLCAASLMAQMKDKAQPRSMILMGGPIDTRRAETAVTKLADERPIAWFRDNLVSRVPVNYPGAGREVYPGFIQLSSFMMMNFDRHITAHKDFFQHLVRGDDESAEKHRDFYDEYLAVMDVTAEFYLQTVERVFQTHALPKGEFRWKDMIVDPSAIRKTALLTIEGELDDISAPGQTEAAQSLCSALPAGMKKHHLQMGVGHYGIFNGSKWRNAICPVVHDFIRAQDKPET